MSINRPLGYVLIPKAIKDSKFSSNTDLVNCFHITALVYDSSIAAFLLVLVVLAVPLVLVGIAVLVVLTVLGVLVVIAVLAVL